MKHGILNNQGRTLITIQFLQIGQEIFEGSFTTPSVYVFIDLCFLLDSKEGVFTISCGMSRDMSRDKHMQNKIQL